MATNIKTYPNLIDSTWKTSSITRLEDRNLADHNEIIGLFPIATLDIVRSAIQAARSAFAVWSGTPPPARRAILDRASQILTSRLDDIAMALEGKTLTEAKGEVTRFGRSAGVITLKEAFAFANEVDAGVDKINEPTTGLALNAHLGVFNGSSANTFQEQGQAAVDFYSRTKTIYVNHE